MTKKKKVVKEVLTRRCTQTYCGFYLKGDCQKCDRCGAGPYIINTICARCLACESVPNAIRWKTEDQNNDVSENESDEIKILKMMKLAIEQRIQELKGTPQQPLVKERRPIIIRFK